MMTGLDRSKTIRLYLPADYASSEQSYPVVYMHDGQNLFDHVSADGDEWQVDEILDGLGQSEQLQVIVVGIDSSAEYRHNEHSPWVNNRYGEAQGQGYMAFLVEVVKPYIDTHYRTLTDRNNTAIMGSSMGGLISHYALHAYPDTFSKAGIFSPAYWYSPQVFTFSESNKVRLDARLYIMYGDKEGDGMIADAFKMQRQLRRQGHPLNNMVFKRVEGGQHSEVLWKEQFSEAIVWLFASPGAS
jgi:predicted alpha/beta superfamily hydrolase